ncbi:MAG: hypothetical protein R6X22_10770 [Gemmatimonadota bacterium]
MTDFELARRLGRTDGGAEDAFGRVTDARLGHDGRIFVADVLAHTVLVFGPNEMLLYRLGRSGEGPGEFSGILKLGPGERGGVRAFDQRLWRETLFDAEGSLLHVFSPPRPLVDIGQPYEVRYDGNGHLLRLSFDQFRETLLESLGGRARAVVRGLVWIDRFEEENGAWRHLLQVPSIEVYFADGGLTDRPYGRRPLWTVGPEGDVWHADSGEYRIRRLTPAGEEILEIEAKLDPVPITDEERRTFYEVLDRPDLGEDARRRLRRNRSELDVPEFRPALRQLIATDGGGIWVRPETAPGDDAAPARWHAYTADGDFEGVVRLPAGFRPTHILGNEVVGIERDSLGVSYVSVYRPARTSP